MTVQLKEVMLIGGPAAGRRERIPVEVRIKRVMVRVQPFIESERKPTPFDRMAMTDTTYRATAWAVEKKDGSMARIEIWIHEGMSSASAMAELLECYRPGTAVPAVLVGGGAEPENRAGLDLIMAHKCKRGESAALILLPPQ